MESPGGNGSRTGEGRKAALLLLRGGRQLDADGTSECASSLPSSNAQLIELIAELGVLQPIVVLPDGDGRNRLVEGRRRSKAVQVLVEDNGGQSQRTSRHSS
jgi:ParB-like nuclease domain